MFAELGSLLKNVGKIANYIIDLFKLLWDIVVACVDVITKPYEFIKLIGKLVVFFVLVFFAIVWQILGKHVYVIFMIIVTTLVNLIFYVFGVIFQSTFYVLDVKMLRGWIYPIWYYLFLATENPPDAWFMNGGFHKNNINDRNVFTWHKCGPRSIPYKRYGSIICEPMPHHRPSLCPQANIYRVHSGQSIVGPVFPKRFKPSYTFLASGNKEKQKIVDEYTKHRNDFFQTCNLKNTHYDNLSKNICTTSSIYGNSSLTNACYDTYCSNGTRYPFCSTLTHPQGVTDPYENDEKESYSKTVVFNLLFLTTSISIIAIMTKYSTN
jgi:hypothetical protein